MNIVTLAVLLKIEFPAVTVRLCSGGVVTWSAETFTGKDATFGAVENIESLTEGVGTEVPALQLTLVPDADADIADLADAPWQNSRVRMWIAEVTEATGAVSGTPTLMFDGLVDTMEVNLGRGERLLDMVAVAQAERLFQSNIGNTLSPRFHKSIFSGETGEDAAINLSMQVSWGVSAPTGGSGATYQGGGGFGTSVISEAVRNV